jgi:hypothetical protein
MHFRHGLHSESGIGILTALDEIPVQYALCGILEGKRGKRPAHVLSGIAHFEPSCKESTKSDTGHHTELTL